MPLVWKQVCSMTSMKQLIKSSSWQANENLKVSWILFLCPGKGQNVGFRILIHLKFCNINVVKFT